MLLFETPRARAGEADVVLVEHPDETGAQLTRDLGAGEKTASVTIGRNAYLSHSVGDSENDTYPNTGNRCTLTPKYVMSNVANQNWGVAKTERNTKKSRILSGNRPANAP